jgi:hypothetical protein
METKQREQFMSIKWFIVYKVEDYKRTNSTNAVELRYIGKYLYTVGCKWENKLSKIQVRIEKGRAIF